MYTVTVYSTVVKVFNEVFNQRTTCHTHESMCDVLLTAGVTVCVKELYRGKLHMQLLAKLP